VSEDAGLIAHPPSSRDTELVASVLGGHPAAFERLMRQHNRRLFRAARAILRDDAEAEDALQEGYLSAYQALPQFRGQSALATWLTRIVVNKALERLRRRARRDGVPEDIDAHEEAPAAPADTPEAQAMRRELRRMIESAVDRLPDGCRAVFMLRGKPAEARSAYEFPTDGLKAEADVLRFAAGLEKAAVSAYLGAVPSFGDPELAKAAASILGDEAMHWAVLRQVLGEDPVPVAFVA